MKRFTETSKWEDSWFYKLSPSAKLLWLYVCDKCDHAGVIEINLEMASFFTGLKLTEKHVEELKEKVVKISDKKHLIPKFISFQFGTPKESCPAHGAIFRALSSNGLKYPFNYPTPSLSPSVVTTHKEEEEEKEEEKEGGVKRGIFVPPTIDEVLAWGVHNNLPEEDCRKAWFFYDSKGWMVGKNKMKNWRSALAGWEPSVPRYSPQGELRPVSPAPYVRPKKDPREMTEEERKEANAKLMIEYQLGRA